MAAHHHNSLHLRQISTIAHRSCQQPRWPSRRSPCVSSRRGLSATATLSSKQKRILPLRSLPKGAPPPPPYPYHKPQLLYKQHLTGLYGGSIVKFGNTVSKRNEIKTRRRWEPNSMHKRLYSLALGRFIRVKITTAVMKTVDKCGGIDNYLLGTKPQRVKELGDEGWRLRWLILRTLKAQGDRRVFEDPVLRKELELGDAAALARGDAVVVPDADATVVDVGIPQQRSPPSIEEEQPVLDGLDVQGIIRERLREQRHMQEEQGFGPPSVWQRIGDAAHAPVRWSNSLVRRIFRR